MVELKNIMEDLVLETLDNLEEVKAEQINSGQKKEVLAYVLNRIKPMYITSNRGFTNVIQKYQNDPQFLADIMVQISTAIKIIKKTSQNGIKVEELSEESHYYFFPKIYGKVVSSKTFMYVEQAVVTLYIENQVAATFFEFWQNPLELQPRDEGIFCFAPKPVQADRQNETRVFSIRIQVQRGDNKHDKMLSYECSPALLNSMKKDFMENVLQVEDIYVPF